jgi:cytochrome c
MFDTMTLTKVTASICASLLIFLMGSWAAESIYHTGPGEAHGEGEEIVQAYTIDTGEAEVTEVAADAGPAFADVFAAADAAEGEKVFGKCKACHKLDGGDGTGPHLNGVVNRNKGVVAGFGYSEVLASLTTAVWSPENLNGFLENPKKYMPGTKMSFAGLGKVEDRANVIAYLATTQ